MDTDILPLKSFDHILNSTETKSAVVCSVFPKHGDRIINNVIMAKPHSPFIWRWMLTYRDFDPDWDHNSGVNPWKLWNEGDPDVTMLPYTAVSATDDLDKMWIGKSWLDIDLSLASHFWDGGYFQGKKYPPQIDLNPETIRSIDTPLFCRARKMFDNMDGDGYVSTPWKDNPNCTVTWVSELKPERYGLFADYRMDEDTQKVKWVDSSGYHNHGWAMNMDIFHTSRTNSARALGEGSYAFLPAPADWDSRAGSIRLSFQPHQLAFEKEVGVMRVRLDGGEIIYSLEASDAGCPKLKLEWLGTSKSDVSWTSPSAYVYLFFVEEIVVPSQIAGTIERRFAYFKGQAPTLELPPQRDTHLLRSKTNGHHLRLSGRQICLQRYSSPNSILQDCPRYLVQWTTMESA